MSRRTAITGAVLVAIAVLASCGPKVDHPAPADALEADGTVIGSVNARSVTAEEVQEFSKRTGITDPAKLRAKLVERELLVDQALQAGATPGIQHARKRAMVRALLADEIEAKVTAENVDQRIVDEVLPRMAAELRGASGEHALAVFVGPRTTKRKQAEKWADKTKSAAEKVHAWLAEEPSAERLLSFDATTVEKPNGATINKSLTVVGPETPDEAVPKGWVKNPSLHATLRSMEVGSLSDPIPVGFGYAILLRQEPVVPQSDVTDEEVEQAARVRARDALRTAHLEELIKQLRKEAHVETYPGLIEQQQVQNQ